mmetsp:Transcript_65909/g.187200  ORF Transcript_65909/g.187200 Transcript_65909/m.187200 type:complete len:213 (-) Transcript_65909:1447-2085(-)
MTPVEASTLRISGSSVNRTEGLLSAATGILFSSKTCSAARSLSPRMRFVSFAFWTRSKALSQSLATTTFCVSACSTCCLSSASFTASCDARSLKILQLAVVSSNSCRPWETSVAAGTSASSTSGTPDSTPLRACTGEGRSPAACPRGESLLAGWVSARSRFSKVAFTASRASLSAVGESPPGAWPRAVGGRAGLASSTPARRSTWCAFTGSS